MSPSELDWPQVDPSHPTYGVIGWPVSHSLSPQIHQAAFRALGIDSPYERLPVPPGAMPVAVPALVDRGFAGVNVTMPHKEAAFELATVVTSDVELLRAANTLVVNGEEIQAHNTDVPGFIDFLDLDVGWSAKDKHALIYGAGGAARACALALARAGIGELTVALRDPQRSGDLAGCVGDVSVLVIDFASAAAVRTDLLVNATPVGSRGELLPTPRLHPQMLVVDLLYAPAETPLLVAARDAGAQAHGGRGLLVRQAAHSFKIWTGSPAPVEVMWEAAKRSIPPPS